MAMGRGPRTVRTRGHAALLCSCLVTMAVLMLCVATAAASPRKRMMTLQTYLSTADAEEQKWHKIALEEAGEGNAADGAAVLDDRKATELQEFRRAEARLTVKHVRSSLKMFCRERKRVRERKES
eukprot:325279-Rhodomonas_salina.2